MIEDVLIVDYPTGSVAKPTRADIDNYYLTLAVFGPNGLFLRHLYASIEEKRAIVACLGVGPT